MNNEKGLVLEPSKERIKELKASGYSVHVLSDQDPCLYAWLHSSGASQAYLRDKQPYRMSAAKAWDDCDAYASGFVPSVANPDWIAK